MAVYRAFNVNCRGKIHESLEPRIEPLRSFFVPFPQNAPEDGKSTDGHSLDASKQLFLDRSEFMKNLL